MDHPVAFVTKFAQLVRLVEGRADVVAQKAALRGCLVASKNGAIVLSVREGVLLAGGFPVPSDRDVALLVARIGPLAIDSVVFEAGAAPSDVLAAARWLIDSAGPYAGNSAVISGLRTVRVEPLARSESSETDVPSDGGETRPALVRRRSGLTFAVDAPSVPRRKSGAPAATGATKAPRKSGAVPATHATTQRRKSGTFTTIDSSGIRRRSGMVAVIDFVPLPRTRAMDLLDVLDRAGGGPEVQRAVNEVISEAELGVRNGDLDVLADAATGLFARQAQVRGDELTRLCASALDRLLTPAVLRLLTQVAARTRPRADAIRAVLARAGEEGSAAVISQVILAPTLADRRLHFEMLLKLPSAIHVLSKMLGADQWQAARNAAHLLGELHATEAQAALGAALQHEDERVRRAAAHALAQLGTTPSVQSLRTALADPSPLVRVQAANGLANRKGTRSATTLARALDAETDTEVQLAILAALGRVGTTEAVNRLIRAAEPDGRLFRKKPVTFRVAAVHALGDVRTPAARAVLQALATDKEREVREAVLRVAMQPPRDHADRDDAISR